jgi:hypothetical protein
MKKFESLKKYELMNDCSENQSNNFGGIQTYQNKYCTEDTLVITNPSTGQGRVSPDKTWEGLTPD